MHMRAALLLLLECSCSICTCTYTTCLQAATQGVVQAQYSLGLMYQYGKSVEQNTGMAIELFTRAARQVR